MVRRGRGWLLPCRSARPGSPEELDSKAALCLNLHGTCLHRLNDAMDGQHQQQSYSKFGRIETGTVKVVIEGSSLFLCSSGSRTTGAVTSDACPHRFYSLSIFYQPGSNS